MTRSQNIACLMVPVVARWLVVAAISKRAARRMSFTAEQLATCAEREVKQRRHVCPRWVEAQWMAEAFADQQIAMMEQTARDYRAKADAVAAKSDLFGGAA